MDQGTLSTIILIVIVVGVFAYRAVRQAQSGKAWEEAAAKLGLTYQKAGGESKLSGKHRGRDVRASIVQRRSAGRTSSSAYTLVEADHMGERVQETVIVYNPEGYSEKDREDQRKYIKGLVETGDAEIDRYFCLTKASDAEQAKRLIAGSKLRQAIQNMSAGLGEGIVVTIEGKSVNREMSGRQADEGKMVKVLDSLCDIAEVLESGK